ncbi:MAG: NAD(P)(+) transhydrogenase (Re/Si-specific) subunit beta [Bacteroidota bacterium]
MQYTQLFDLGFLIAVVMFVVGLRRLSSPATARNGNLLAAAGMGVSILLALFYPLEDAPIGQNFIWIILGLIIGAAIGWVTSKRVKMTAMPELVSMFNGLGGACAVAISMVELGGYQPLFEANASTVTAGVHATGLLAMFVGAVAFTGSLLAYGKLAGIVNDRKLKLPQPTLINMVLLALIVAGMVYKVAMPAEPFGIVLAIMGISLLYGFTFVIPIGGADMPVVISLLNAFTGVAAALAGLVYGNQIMLVGGILVGSSGTILTVLMCEAMNRSLLNVIIGGFGSTGGGAAAAGVDGDQVAREVTLNDAAILLSYSDSVVFVPGYGMAVAQAQKAVRELDDLLESNGVSVRYAIHPVAGRMPGHMNVLLAEADVPYPKLLDLDAANDFLKDATVAVIIGANDVVNPAAKDSPGSPIYGMPILEVLQAKNTIVLKRSMGTGYAGVQNPLFFHEKNRMLFGDAKASIENLIGEVKNTI